MRPTRALLFSLLVGLLFPVLATCAAYAPSLAPERIYLPRWAPAGQAGPPAVASPVSRSTTPTVVVSLQVLRTLPPLPTTGLAPVAPPPNTPAASHDEAGTNSEITAGGLTFYVYVPKGAESEQPRRVLVALHGFGYTGPAFRNALRSYAEQDGLVLVAPTLPYQNYFDPALVRQDDLRMMAAMVQVQDGLEARIGLTTQARMLLYGFSRGAQLAHRFALAYPQRVLGVAALSAGSYTMPAIQFSTNGKSQALNFPYGCADFSNAVGRKFDAQAVAKVNFWLAVGGQDNKTQDVARAWDVYEGVTRIERAQNFYASLKGIGANAQLVLFPGASHEETTAMRGQALKFLLALR